MKRVFLILAIMAILIPSALIPVPATSARRDKVILWTRYLGKDKGFERKTPVIDPKNKRLFLSSPSQVICFDSESGELKWQREHEDDKYSFFNGYVALFEGNAIFGNKFGLECMSGDDGGTLWKSPVYVTSNIEIASGVIHLASDDDIFRIDAKTGKTLSVANIPDKYAYNFITFVSKNKVVASTSRGMNKMVDLAKNAVLWQSDKGINELWEKPIARGKYLFVPGMMMRFERLLIIELDTGKVMSNQHSWIGNMDSSDGRILTSDSCISSETLEPLWKSKGGYSRFFDCFDAVFFWFYDEYSISDWNGNTIAANESKPENIRNSYHFYDDVWTKPASYDGKYYLVTSLGFLVCYGNKPESITYTIGDSHLYADGKRISLLHKPIIDRNGLVFVEPRGFLEPLGWVSSHDDDYTGNYMVFHDYDKQFAVVYSKDHLSTDIMDKIITARKPLGKALMIQIENLAMEFGLTMARDGDRIKLSYQSK